MRLLFLTAILIFIGVISNGQSSEIVIYSPDKSIKTGFFFDKKSGPVYSVDYHNEALILPSSLGFETTGGPAFNTETKVISVNRSSANNLWKPIYGERKEIPDRHNQARIHVKEHSTGKEWIITFRVYNEGVAFQYTLLPIYGQDSVYLRDELTEFNFTENFECWVSDRAQSEYRKQKIRSIRKPAERPLVVETGNRFVALGEAKLVDFARMKFLAGEKSNSLVAELHGMVKIKLPYTTPWRTIMIGKSPGDLLEKNYLLKNLNDQCALDQTDWIKPGKVIREVTLTTQGGKACVDFAAENGLQYVEFDAGWYGPENSEESDATTITVDPKRSPGPLDLHEVIEYAESKGIGILVYVNRRALEKQLDEILPLYQSWGIKGVKYGFVQVGTQEWTTWLHEAVKKAAENQLMVDIHDEYRPTGFSRTYPNLMTQEGIRGDEESPTNEHTLITLFTRMLAGAGDNTNCYYAPRVQEKMGGNVSQLAKAVMLYSPWQFLYWYDRPQGSPGKKGGAGSSEGYILNHPELRFFSHLPVVWDETRVLDGAIGKHATIARRSGKDWYVGSLTANESREVNINTGFMKVGTRYKATIYTHDPESKSATKVKIESMNLDAGDRLTFSIAPNSGLAIHFARME